MLQMLFVLVLYAMNGCMTADEKAAHDRENARTEVRHEGR